MAETIYLCNMYLFTTAEL